ncbi:hypothetical protein SAMN05720469_1463 [Fibrobacter intestinalis]|uniref:Major paralogous domain-containing protein n=1 Tax=Fibrobacter intestinalis TaxID=28122 RepID=A0A1M6YPN1_9BACT|nr:MULTISPECIES: hypothetical protein [Fibrobacter]MDD7298584.1 hypothetical protein [Fibrobacter intestinalis]PBC75153.1 hypothetical protein BGW94_2836 [Fibrobacter sp. NR9]SHL20032.1 hypothetical protein SAMN05720469_1463 [Fibrobacter intestinalis]SJZ71610.1 hypothetical protein SAMN02745108_01411 [Fibrobacter intestinalis]
MGKFHAVLAILFLSATLSYAEGGCSGNGQISGIPIQSCYEKLSSFYMGIQADNGMFFIDPGKSVQYGGKTYWLRFFVTSASRVYNQIQALAQTGYATRSSVEIIYPNYATTTVTNANAGLNDANCSTNTDNAGNAAYMYCPIQALSILE